MPHYDHAPITEALIDIRVELAPEVRFEDLQAFRQHLAADYPREETRSVAEVQFGPAVQASAKQTPLGLGFWNSTNNQVVQVRLDGFTFSRLEPYQDFERLRDEARRLWNIYNEVVRPRRITRVAVRYINRFNLPVEPGGRIELEDYFYTYPQVSEKLPPELRDFGPYLVNLRMYQHDLHGILVLNQAMTTPKSPQSISIVLDFDLYVENPPITDEHTLWAFFDRLRERKNLYFEACITEKARELIR